MKKLLILIITMAFFSGTRAQTSKKNLQPFSNIKIVGGFDITLVNNGTNTIKANSGNFDLEDLVIEVKRNDLYIYPKPGVTFDFPVDLELSCTSINSVKLSGSSMLTCKEEISTNNFSIIKSGSSLVRLYKLNVENLIIKSSGSGRATLSGTASSCQLTLSGAGSIDANGLTANNVDADHGGSGMMELNVEKYLKAHISGRGRFDYTGSPKTDITRGPRPQFQANKTNITTKDAGTRAETSTISLQPFSKMKAAGGVNITLVNNGTNAIKVNTAKFKLEDLGIELRQDYLYLYSKSEGYLNFPIDLELSCTSINSVNLSGSIMLTSKEEINASDFLIKKSGSSLVRFDKLNVENLSIKSSGSGKSELSGKVSSCELTLSGSGKIKAYGLTTNNVDAELGGSGIVELKVEKYLKANI